MKTVFLNLLQRAKVEDPQAQHQKRYFVWQEQIHSLCSYHECWQYPLQLVLDAVNLTEELPTTYPHSHNNVAKLPESLPHTCQACHLHTWITQVLDQSCDFINIVVTNIMQGIFKNSFFFLKKTLYDYGNVSIKSHKK